MLQTERIATPKTMQIRTLLHYLLFGNRQAILAIAANRHALWLGFLFVVSAGFAREYDGEDLLHEPWHLLIPVASSLAASLGLFTLTYGLAVWRGDRFRLFFRRYLSFLGLFWFTAPLAWLYAIPYERFLGPGEAVQANLVTLGLVSVWRVALMIRVLVVLMNHSAVAAIVLVLFFGDVLALILMNFLPIPIIDIMGGVRLSEGERVLRNLAATTCLFAGCSFPALLFATLFGAVKTRPRWELLPIETPSPLPSRGLRVLAVMSVTVWVVILPFTQPEQWLRFQVERAFKEGRIDDALAIMSAHQRNQFPPHWTPPPLRLDWAADGRPPLLDVLEAIETNEVAPWVREAYLQKLAASFGLNYRAANRERFVDFMRRLPEASNLLDEYAKKPDASKEWVEEIRREMHLVPPNR
jgi:hypothetical protein